MTYCIDSSARLHVIRHARQRAFTLVESMAAVTLLAFIGISVWVVLERCTASAADSVQRMRAFEIARENMEKILGLDSVQEMTEYGTSEKFPDIRWQTTIESFYEPATSQMWVRAVCSAEYTDTSGEPQNVELTNWLTKLSNAQMTQLTQKSELQKQQTRQTYYRDRGACGGICRRYCRNHKAVGKKRYADDGRRRIS